MPLPFSVPLQDWHKTFIGRLLPGNEVEAIEVLTKVAEILHDKYPSTCIGESPCLWSMPNRHVFRRAWATRVCSTRCMALNCPALCHWGAACRVVCMSV